MASRCAPIFHPSFIRAQGKKRREEFPLLGKEGSGEILEEGDKDDE